MIVKKDIDRFLREGRIHIWYSFLPEGNGFKYVGEAQVLPDDADNPATQLFAKHYFGDRLKLTLGPVVKSHGILRDPKRVRFKQFPYCYDLRAMGDHFKIAPHEVISIQTNERIALGPNLAALVLPRLTIADSGLIYVPSYIDPCWDGLLQGIIINQTDNSQSLRLGEGVAICRFYELSSEAPHELKDNFPAKSHHYGNNWPRILDEDADPFPVRKRPINDDRVGCLDKLNRFIHLQKKTIQKLGVTSSVVIIVFMAGTIYVKLSDLVELNKRIDSLSPQVSTLSKLVKELRLREPLTGVAFIYIPRGKTVVVDRIPLGPRLQEGATSWVSLVGKHSGIQSLSSRIEDEPGVTGSILTLDIHLSPDNIDRVIPVQWLVVQ